MKSWLARLLLTCFPSNWRADYGLELEELLLRQSPRFTDILDVLISALKEQARRPAIQFGFVLLLAALGLFMAAQVFADAIWEVLSSPIGQALREHGFRPPALISERPYEQLGVVRLGLPLLFMAVGTYPLFLALISALLAPRWPGGKRVRARSFMISSGMVFIFSLLLGIVLWRQSSPLLALMLDRGLAGPGVGSFFVFLAQSTVAWAAIWQLPVLLVFAVRRKATTV